MDPVLRALVIYGFMLIVFRVLGKRTLGQLTPFDLVLLLVVGESASQALMGDDFSMTTAFLLILTLIGVDHALGRLKEWSPRLERVLDGTPLIVVEHGRALSQRMRRAGIDEGDVLMAARETHGLERLEQIKYAVHERNGNISIIPMETGAPGRS